MKLTFTHTPAELAEVANLVGEYLLTGGDTQTILEVDTQLWEAAKAQMQTSLEQRGFRLVSAELPDQRPNFLVMGVPVVPKH